LEREWLASSVVRVNARRNPGSRELRPRQLVPPRTHGGFDNDEHTMNSVLFRILRNKPGRPYTLRDLQY
jgi:hypothetical protein